MSVPKAGASRIRSAHGEHMELNPANDPDKHRAEPGPNRSAVVAVLFEEWDRAGVLYVNWKSTDHLEAGLSGETDLDVLVDTKSIDSALRIAHEAGFRMFRIAVPRTYPGVWDYIAYDPAVGKWIHLHFHAQIICGDRWVKAYHLPFEAGILGTRERVESLGTWAVSPAFELAVLFYRMNAKYPRSWHRKWRVLQEIEYISRKAAGKPVPEELSRLLSPRANAELEAVIRAGGVDPGLLRTLRREFDPKPYRRLGVVDFFFRNIFRYAYRLAAEFTRRKLHRYEWGRRDLPYGGYLAAFVGIDGSGKSTNIERIKKVFASQMNVAVVFFGSGKSGASLVRKAVMTLFGFKAVFASHKRLRETERKPPAQAAGETARLKKAPLYYLAWQYLCLRDKEKALLRARRALANGKLVLADRWPQDQLAGRLDGVRLSAWIESGGLAGRLARREAELIAGIKLLALRQVIVLRIDPETSLARKPGELTREGAADLIADLDRLSWPDKAVKTLIDARKPADEVCSEAASSLWRGMLAHG